MTHIPDALRRAVADRAGDRCEYCHIHEDDTFLPHEIDHIIAEKHGGQTTESNLCLSCFYCNRHKGSDVASVDPITGEVVRLFQPRHDRWDEHFRAEGALIRGLTPHGRATVQLLQMNAPDSVIERAALIRAGRME